MGTAVADDDKKHLEVEGKLTSVVAYKDAIGRWSVTVGGDQDWPTGVARGDVGESFDVVLDASIECLAKQLRGSPRQVTP